MQFNTLKSNMDNSVNFVSEVEGGGAFECRFVHRPGYPHLSLYLSSHTGCKMACRFCHLTSTGQTMMHAASSQEYAEQAEIVLQYAKRQDLTGVDQVNFNFMARGEPLLNYSLLNNTEVTLGRLRDLTFKHLPYIPKVRFNISSIFPVERDKEDYDNFRRANTLWLCAQPDLYFYYSLYSLNPQFRKRWLPMAADPYQILDTLRDCQEVNDREVFLHWAFIKGENDDEITVRQIAAEIKKRKLHGWLNVVRYNPPSAAQGVEADMPVIKRNLEIIAEALGDGKIIDRVGFDIKASCGTFVEP